MWFYKCLDIFFFIFHTAILILNVFGWILPRTRKVHRYMLGLTYLSWFGLGLWYGFGYCICTDWHFQVREAMEIYDESYHYVHFLVYVSTGINLNQVHVTNVTYIVFAFSTIMAMFFWIKEVKNKKAIT